MLFRLAATVSILFPLSVFSEEILLNPCPTPIVQELMVGNVLNSEGLAKSGIKPPSSWAFFGVGVADAVSRNVVGAASNAVLGTIAGGGSGVLSENDHLVLIFKNEQGLAPLDAKEKMRVDVMETVKNIIGAQSISVEGNRYKKYFLTGGSCDQVKCQLVSNAFANMDKEPKLLADGALGLMNIFSVIKGNSLLFVNNPDLSKKLTLDLDRLGYLAGFWQAKTQTIYSSGSACQITNGAFKTSD